MHGETTPVMVGLARCSDCTRKNNMNAEAAFKDLQVAIKCKNDMGEYESKAVGQVDKTSAFSVPLVADLVGVNGELKKDCLAQLHDASSVPCHGREPSKIIAAWPSHDRKMTVVHVRSSTQASPGLLPQASDCPSQAYSRSPYLPFIKPPVIIPPKHNREHDHDHGHDLDHDHDHDHNHGHDHDHNHDHDHSLTPVAEPPTMSVYIPMPPKGMLIYHPAAQCDAVTEPQLFKKMLPFLNNLPFFPPAEQNSKLY